MNGFERRRAAIKEKILEAATTLIISKNFKDIGIRDIAKKAGVSPVSIYNIFENKENVAREAFFNYFNNEAAAFIALIDDPLKSFKEKCEEMIAMSVEISDRVGSDAMSPDSFLWSDPKILEFKNEYGMAKTMPAMMRLIHQGKTEGAIPDNISDESILFYISCFNNVDHALIQSKEKRREIAHLFFYGLLGKGGETI